MASMTRVTIDVSGVLFKCDAGCFTEHESHTLTKMYISARKNKNDVMLIADRSAACFGAILTFYQTGELHMPTHVCPAAFKNELMFWNVPESAMSKCCLYRYATFLDDQTNHHEFTAYRATVEISASPESIAKGAREPSAWTSVRHRMWNIVDNREASSLARVYLILVFLMVILSILVLALSTVPSLQKSPTKCDMLTYLEHTKDKRLIYFRQEYGEIDCNFNGLPTGQGDLIDLEAIETTLPDGTTLKLPDLFVRHPVFDVFDIFLGVFFTIDVILRLTLCPSFRKYFTSILNIFDILALLGFYVHVIVINIEKERRYDFTWVRFIEYLQVLRILRLCRVLKNVRASHVLAFSVRKNARDMALLALLLLVVVSTSSCLIYFIENHEDFYSIPLAWYWAVITITTVGYGDLYPKTGSGQFIAAVLAISGVLMLAITLPMFVNNFLTLYNLSTLDDTIDTICGKQAHDRATAVKNNKVNDIVETKHHGPEKDRDNSDLKDTRGLYL